MKTIIVKKDEATPLMKAVQEGLKPNSAGALKLRKTIGARMEKLTKNHILFASASRHKTAQRLNASPTGYLVRLAQAVETEVNPGAGSPVKVYVYGEIFERIDRDVIVKPKNKEWLAIPATRQAYGRRPREIPGLRFLLLRKKNHPDPLAALVSYPGGKRKAGGRKNIKIWYWLKKGVTLPRDPGLLPSARQYADELELAAVDFLNDLEKQSR